ncbi:putative esterase [Fusarium oxysporum f. sp. raphani]|uniref:Putative esterase n=1 Tax=Fusarium oxysporum f. sp. raphani TaxID=96318 RepID=A0A8J5QAX8_FUSOX|nr:putative esterase [Fusarium oxysporum f. sp. raphani]
MEWLGHAELNFTHAPSPRKVQEKDGNVTDLLSICEKATPPCRLNPLLFNGHLQTMWTATKPAGPKIYYKRKIFDADHKIYHGTFAVDFAVEPFEAPEDPSLSRRTAYFTPEEFEHIGSDDHKPMLVVLHGLSGGSHEIYLRHTIAPLIGEGGWEVCVVNSRGCARSKITSGVLYNARATWDIRQTIKWLQKTFPNRPLFGLGFSLGANMLTNYIKVSSKILQNSYIGKEVYLRVMGSALKELAATHRTELEKYSKIDVEAVMNITYLYEFDRLIQCPSWGIRRRIPFLAVHSTDDPIAVKEAIPYEEFKQNPNTVLLTSSLGGHLCWFETSGDRWFTKPVANFLNHLAFKTDLNDLRPLVNPNNNDHLADGHGYIPMRRKLVIVED